MCADCSVCEGSFPSPVECIIIVWVFGLLWKEMKEVYEVGIFCYLSDLWSLAGKPQLFSSFLIFPIHFTSQRQLLIKKNYVSLFLAPAHIFWSKGTNSSGNSGPKGECTPILSLLKWPILELL